MRILLDLRGHHPCSLTKYTSAGQVLGEVLKKLAPQVRVGKHVLELCIEPVSPLPFRYLHSYHWQRGQIHHRGCCTSLEQSQEWSQDQQR